MLSRAGVNSDSFGSRGDGRTCRKNALAHNGTVGYDSRIVECPAPPRVASVEAEPVDRGSCRSLNVQRHTRKSVMRRIPRARAGPYGHGKIPSGSFFLAGTAHERGTNTNGSRDGAPDPGLRHGQPDQAGPHGRYRPPADLLRPRAPLGWSRDRFVRILRSIVNPSCIHRAFDTSNAHGKCKESPGLYRAG
jgi:hypothetical protein